MVEEKRNIDGVTEENSGSSCKRVKMRDLQSVLQYEGIATHYPESSKTKEAKGHSEATTSQSAPTTASSHRLDLGSKMLDLNSEACLDDNLACNDAPIRTEDERKRSLPLKLSTDQDHKPDEDAASSANQFPFHRSNNPRPRNPRDALECASTTGPLEGKDSLKVWTEMKQNGFISPSYGGIPVPKRRGRKRKSDVLQQKIEQAKKEQVDRFTKIAAPSGLLDGLNPGIINHVRNSKQVHSIIQALVRSEKREGGKHGSHAKPGNKEFSERKKDPEIVNPCVIHRPGLDHEAASSDSMAESKPMPDHHKYYDRPILSMSDNRGGYVDLGNVEGTFCTNNNKEDVLPQKMSRTMVMENLSCLSNQESANVDSVDALSFKAATVASQWLQLLHQDIKGRLAALRRSRKRVRAVITTELPFLIEREFSAIEENDPSVTKDTFAEMHALQWGKLFNGMDKALSEEEKQLECWLNQVSKLQLHCEQGLNHVQWSDMFGFQRLANDSRSKIQDSEQELAVKAAAASIYSTSNFLSSKANLSCF